MREIETSVPTDYGSIGSIAKEEGDVTHDFTQLSFTLVSKNGWILDTIRFWQYEKTGSQRGVVFNRQGQTWGQTSYHQLIKLL